MALTGPCVKQSVAGGLKELVLETPERWLVDWYNQTRIEKRHLIVVISDKVISRRLTY